MKKSDILDVVIDRLIKESDLAVDREDVSLDSNLKETFDLDSMQSVSMIMDMEEKYDIDIDEDEMDKLKTIDDLVNIIQTKLTGSH